MLDAIVTVYVLTVWVKFAIIITFSSTVTLPFVQLSNAYVYCASEAAGVAVTDVPFAFNTLLSYVNIVPYGTFNTSDGLTVPYSALLDTIVTVYVFSF